MSILVIIDTTIIKIIKNHNMPPLKKAALCSDIHLGRKANSLVHNQDCLNYLQWFCDQVKQDPTIDHVAFLGDWHENRSAINISTLAYSYRGAKMLNDLGLPVYFCVGNHDLYYRHTREIHSLEHFSEFSNFRLIEEPYYAPPSEVHGGVLFCPFLFHEEYDQLQPHLEVPTWMGHFEFKGFQVTGYGLAMPTGPEAQEFIGPEYIFSGHFHKRQADGNIVYIGNTFPMDFGDAGDNNRGMAVYDHTTRTVEFTNWDDCPKYIITTLSKLKSGDTKLYPDARVKCIVDIIVTFEETTLLRQKYLDEFKLREFILEESGDLMNAITGTETSVNVNDDDLATVNQLVLQMLQDISHDQIDNDLLIQIYCSLGEEANDK